MVQLGVDWTEVGVSLDALDEVIVTPFLLDHGSCLLREHSDFLMAILGRQERKQPKTRSGGYMAFKNDFVLAWLF